MFLPKCIRVALEFNTTQSINNRTQNPMIDSQLWLRPTYNLARKLTGGNRRACAQAQASEPSLDVKKWPTLYDLQIQTKPPIDCNPYHQSSWYQNPKPPQRWRPLFVLTQVAIDALSSISLRLSMRKVLSYD